jgi:hypothetical protein
MSFDRTTFNRKLLFFTWLLGVLGILLPWVGFSEERVILVTLDGVRWQEVFQGSDPKLGGGATSSLPMPWLHAQRESGGLLLGDDESPLFISNPHGVSLPGYQSLFTGRVQEQCHNNFCGRPADETLQERVLFELGLESHQVATIGSWEKIGKAAQSGGSGTLPTPFINVEHQALEDDIPLEAELREKLNQLEKKRRPPWFNARWDHLTWQQAMRFWRVHHPRLLIVSLVDSDEWGHRGDYPRYLHALRNYDRWLSALTKDLRASENSLGQETTLIVTTDHGRGDGRKWSRHGAAIPGSERIWLYVNPAPRSRFAAKFTRERLLRTNEPHRTVRPSVERILGLVPTPSAGTAPAWF